MFLLLLSREPTNSTIGRCVKNLCFLFNTKPLKKPHDPEIPDLLDFCISAMYFACYGTLLSVLPYLFRICPPISR